MTSPVRHTNNMVERKSLPVISEDHNVDNKQDQHNFETDIKHLFTILNNNVYNNCDIFLKELLCNAIDGIRERIKQKPNEEIEHKIEVKYDNGILSVKDTGIGISNIGEMKKKLGTIAYSDKSENKELIGEFGIGLYSVFMVAKQMIFSSKNASWISNGDTYRLDKSEHYVDGTEVLLMMKDDTFGDHMTLLGIIAKYVKYTNIPIHLWMETEDEETSEFIEGWVKVNEQNPWYDEVDLDEVYREVTENDISLYYTNFDADDLSVIIFIPNDIYSKRVCKTYMNDIFITDKLHVLPEYLSFCSCMINFKDKTMLNLSKEYFQKSDKFKTISNAITKMILISLCQMEQPVYDKFYRMFGKHIKLGINDDVENRDKLFGLLRYDTVNKKNICLDDFKGDKYYYITMNDLTSPYLEWYNKNNIDVLVFSEPFDQLIATRYLEHNKKQFINIVENTSNVSNDLTKEIRSILGDKISNVVVANKLVDYPCIITTAKNSIPVELENAVNNVSSDNITAVKILEINMNSKIIQKIINKKDKTKDIILLYQLSMINAGYKINEPSIFSKIILDAIY